MGLIAHYRLDGSAEDAVGDNHGTASNVTWVDGKLGRAGEFDGSVVEATVSGSEGATFSVSCWVKPLTIKSSALVTQRGPHSHDRGLILRPEGNLAAFVRNAGGSWQQLESTETASVGATYHVALVQNKSIAYFYVDGHLVDSKDIVTYSDYLEDYFNIGSYTDTGNYKCHAVIDDVRIYDHALSPREVRDLSLGLVSHFPMLKDEWGSHGTSSPVVVNAALSEEGGFEFTGSSSYIDLGSDQNFVGKADNSPMTVCAWIKPSAFSTRDMILSKNPNRSTSNYSYMFGLISGNMNAYTGSAWRAFSTKELISIGKWAHVAWVFDGTTLKGYVNGELVGSRSDFAYTNKEPSTVKIGGYHSSSDFRGIIKDHRVYSTALTDEQIKELVHQRASIDSEGSVHTPAIQQNPRARYIRDWTNGSTANSSNHWVEVRAVYAGENISLGKPVTTSGNTTNLSKISDGTTTISGYATVRGTGPVWVQVDLEEVREIDEVQVWHYYSGGRTYYDTKTEISEDGINWTTIFDSAVSGTYPETSAGVTHQAKALGPIGATPHGLRLPDVSEIGVARGLVAWYPLIGDTKDYAGINHAVNNGAVATAEGYEFDGAANYLLIEPTTVDANADFTLSFWIYPRGTSTYTLYCARTRLGDGLSVFRLSSGKIRFDLGDQWTTTVTPPLDEWSHVTVSREGDSKFIFFNGALVASTSIGTLTNFNPNLSTVGASQVNGSSYGNYTDGIIRDFRSFDRSLTEEEVGILYNLTTPTGSKMAVTDDCLYVKGQIKEVIS